MNQPPARGARGFSAEAPVGLFRWKDQEKEQGTVPKLGAKVGERGAAGFLPSRPSASAGLWLSRAGPGPSSPASRGVMSTSKGVRGAGGGRQLPTLHLLRGRISG